MGLVLGIDFDGTLVKEGASPPQWRKGAQEGLRKLKEAGHKLVLFSARLTPRHEVEPGPAGRMEASEFWRTGFVPRDVEQSWSRYDEMREFLSHWLCWDIFDVVWQGAGKPPCDYFIDDRSEPADWPVVTDQFSVG